MLIASKKKLKADRNPKIYIGNHHIKQVSKKKVLRNSYR